MLLSTDTVVYEILQDGDQPMPVFDAAGGIRRVAEGDTVSVAALADGDLVLLGGEEPERLATGLEEEIWSLLILSEDPLQVLVGTVAPHIYHVDADGNVERNGSFAALDVRETWSTPWGGPPVARSMAAGEDGYVYAGIEQGSVMRSPDGGENWEPVTPDLNKDIHQVATCPEAPARVYANTARAVFISEDHGESWQHLADDLDERYGRAIAVHQEDPDLVLATVSDGPHGDNVHGQLWRSNDGGENWAHVAGVFPKNTKKNIDTYQVAITRTGTAWACVGDTLYVGRDRATMWEEYWTGSEDINVLSTKK
jgi:photosystem II stability/assembly factor-like uncharacterized protein